MNRYLTFAFIIILALGLVLLFFQYKNKDRGLAETLTKAETENKSGITEPEILPKLVVTKETVTPEPEKGQIVVPEQSDINQTNKQTPEMKNDSQAINVSTPLQNAPVSKKKSVSWGAFVGYSQSELMEFERLAGDTVDMRGVFVNWNDAFPTDFGWSLKSEGKTMVIYWEQYGVTLDEIIAGKTDKYIRNFAIAAEIYGGEVILAPMHEMNGNWDPWGGFVGSNSPAKVVATWKHIVTEFGEVSNVKFAWTINNVSEPNTPANDIEHYYPGDEYVDYVAVDGFNFNDPWQTFDEIFGDVLMRLKLYQKPIYILSMASAEGAKKSNWITDAFTVQLPKHPEVKGWIWFNEKKEKDWRINSDESSQKAFSAGLK